MLANFFGKSNPINYIIIFALFLVYFSVAFFLGFSQSKDLLWIASMIGLFVLLFFFFNFILAKNKLTLYNSYGFFFFVLLMGMFPFTIFDRQELVINVLLLIMLRRVYSLRTSKDVFKKMFDSGFWLSILFILNPFTLVFGLLLYISIGMFQKLNFQTALIPLVGFVTPLLGFFSYCFWMDDVTSFSQLFAWYTDYDFSFYATYKIMIPLIFVAMVVFFSVLFKTPKVLLISGNYRKFWTLVIFNLLVSVGFILLTKERNGAELMTVFFPVAVILTNGIEGLSKRFSRDLILGIFVLFPIILFII